MNKSGSEDNFERNWQEAFENASVNPPSRIWDSVNQSLNSEDVAKYKYQVKVYRFAAAIALLIAATTILVNVNSSLFVENENLTDTGGNQLLVASQNTSDLVKSIQEAGSKLQANDLATSTYFEFSENKPEPSPEYLTVSGYTPATISERRTADLLVTEDPFNGGNYQVDGIQGFDLTYFLDARSGKDDKKFFAGLNVGSSAVNPNYRSANTEFAQSDILPTGVGLQNTSTSTTTSVIQSVSEGMDNGISLGLGVDLGMKLSNRFVLESGIRVGQTLLNSNSTYYLENTVLSRNVQLDAEAILVERSGENEFNDERTILSEETVQAQNAFNFASLPLTAGYILMDEKVSVAIKAGVLSNFYLGHKTNNVEENQVVSVNPGSDSPYRLVSFAGTAGMSLGYQIFRSFDLMVEPSYSHNFQPLTKESADFNTSFSRFGLNAGIRYNFR